MEERRIAVLGGTFDPIHNGHLEIVRAINRNLRIDQLLIVPANRPPHKTSREIAGAYHRFSMAVLASLDEPRVLVSTIELEMPERPYTFETVERLQNDFGIGTRLFLVIGADSFEEITTWRESARLLSSTDLVVVTRPGHEVASTHLDERFRSTVVDVGGDKNGVDVGVALNTHRIYIADYVNNPVSSTEVRQRVRDGKSIDDLVPPRVAAYIEKYELYKRQSNG